MSQFSSVQSLSHVRLFATPWTIVIQASLSITNCWSLPKPKPIESMMPSNHLILSCPLLLLPSIFPSIRVFQLSQLFESGGQSIGVSASTSVLPMNTQDWSLEWTGWISLLSPTPQFQSISSSALSFIYSPTLTSTHEYWKKTIALTRKLVFSDILFKQILVTLFTFQPGSLYLEARLALGIKNYLCPWVSEFSWKYSKICLK